MTIEKTSLFGEYKAVDQAKLESADDSAKEAVNEIREGSKKEALKDVMIFPLIMLIGIVGLIIYYRIREGYKPVVLADQHGRH